MGLKGVESLGWVIGEGWQRAGNEMEREALNNKVEKQGWEERKKKDFKTRCNGLELYPLWYSLRTSVKIGIAFKCRVEKLLMSWNIFVNTAVLSSPFSTVSSQILSPLLFFLCAKKWNYVAQPWNCAPFQLLMKTISARWKGLCFLDTVLHHKIILANGKGDL